MVAFRSPFHGKIAGCLLIVLVGAAFALTPPSSSRRRQTDIAFSYSRIAATNSHLQAFSESDSTTETSPSLVATRDDEIHIWSESELMEFASQQGILLSLTTLGPGYRAIARAKHNESLILGYVEGFLRPGGTILHLDKMEVFHKPVKKAKKDNPEEFSQGGTVFGIGLLMGYICLLYGKDNGYTQAEFLAIDDEERQHRKLVAFYKRSGFDIIRYVGDAIGDIPDRMVWGGCGTLMRQNMDTLLQKWTLLLTKSRANKQARKQQ